MLCKLSTCLFLSITVIVGVLAGLELIFFKVASKPLELCFEPGTKGVLVTPLVKVTLLKLVTFRY